MAEPDAPGRVTVLVTAPAQHLSWLVQEVTARGGELGLSLQAIAVLAAQQSNECPLTDAELDAVLVVTVQDTWELAAAAAMLSVEGLRTRLRAAQRRLGVGTIGRLVTICLAKGWVPVPAPLSTVRTAEAGHRDE